MNCVVDGLFLSLLNDLNGTSFIKLMFQPCETFLKSNDRTDLSQELLTFVLLWRWFVLCEGTFQRQLQNGLHAQAPVTLAPVPLVGLGLFGQSTEVAFPLPMTKRPLGDGMRFPLYQPAQQLVTMLTKLMLRCKRPQKPQYNKPSDGCSK